MKKGESKQQDKILKVVELFSGIGSQAKALNNINAKFVVQAICEWDIHAMVAYDRIHNGGELHKDVVNYSKQQLLEKLKQYNLSANCKNKISHDVLKQYTMESLQLIYSAILNTNNKVNIKDFRGSDLPSNCDIMTYSFPCQDLSNVGHFHGYCSGISRSANNRSGLLWEVERILQERVKLKLDMPKVLMLENVTSLTSDRHSKDFEEWKNSLQNLGYYNKVYKLRSQWYGQPQRRYRLIMLSIFIGVKDGGELLKERLEKYFKEHNLECLKYISTLNIQRKEVEQCLRLDYKNEIYLEEAKQSQPNDTQSRKRIWNDNLKIVTENYCKSKHVDTITTKQDRHPNAGNIYFDYIDNKKSKFRYLTPRECFLLMGFDESDFDKVIIKNPISRGHSKFFTKDNLIHSAGNSIVVAILEQVFIQVIDILKTVINN
ncbi:MAG: DNA (cytosine-5-)-methyltransferase [Firmicutes bacterium]|nr:DNA (cytosine-5-)-methyltransferase [Bacillota bacterium]MCL1954246.1 DNA (cytosine-5-)-methyltransferase [Bacillota bacterium]